MNIIRYVYQWLAALMVVLAVCAACYFCFKSAPIVEPEVVSTVKKEAKVITVFIHGSLLPDNTFIDTLSLSDLQTILFDTIEDDGEYIKSLRRVRSNPQSYKEQIMLAEGFHQVDERDLRDLCQVEDTKVHHCSCCHHAHDHEKQAHHGADEVHAAHYAIACYSTLMKRLFPKYDADYYTFGHLGVLSHRYRTSVAKSLYSELFEKVKEAQDVYETVKVVIVTHSHGGTIALNMASVENELKKGLVIDDLVMFGTPLQIETAPYAYHPMFKRVMNCYSLGDVIQGSDVLTTASRKCYTTFASIESAHSAKDTVYDVQLAVNGDSNAITHGNMWCINHKHITNTHLDPLPYAVMTPALLAAFDNHTFGSSVQVSLRSDEKHLNLHVADVQKKAEYQSPNTYDVLAQLRDQIIVPETAHAQA
jgi:hypothetical protein